MQSLIECRGCSKQFRPRRNSTGKYCTNKCQRTSERRKYIDGWRAGENNGSKPSGGLSMHVRNFLFEKYDNKRCLCGWGETNVHTGRIPLEVDHIDGNADNNLEHNLRLICPNCHALTATYKGANKGNGRHKRRARYRAGKSY